MPFVLTTASVVVCGHGGKFQLAASQTKLKVDGNPVLVEGDLEKAVSAMCPNKPPLKECTKIVAVLTGVSHTLAVDGKKVLLNSATGTTDGLPPPWSVLSAGQTKLQAE